MPRLVLLLLACGACGVPASPFETPDAGHTDTGDASDVCAPEVLCFAGCSVASPGCLKGTLDVDRCACLDEQQRPLPWPDANATAEAMYFDPPVPATLGPGDAFSTTLSVRFSDDTVRAATREATLRFEPEGLLTLDDQGVATAVASGTVTLTATWSGLSTTATVDIRGAEVRAVWVTRFGWTNADDIKRIVNDAADARFNVVLFQVRAYGDAFYRSSLEPWTTKLGGALGKDPGWDPLQVAIDAAHARGLELHAYMNAFTGWAPTVDNPTPPESPPGFPRHVLLRHPEWMEISQAGEAVGDGYQWLSPGIEAVRIWNTDVIKDLVTRYDVDGVHLDRIRYGNTGFGWNALARDAFAASGETDFAKFRTEAVNDQVRRIHAMLQQERPDVTLSAAVWGIHTRLPVDCESRSSQGKSDYFQDSWAWAQGGYVDALVPMIYWEENGPNPCTDWGDLYQTFADNRGGAQIWGGMNVLDAGALNFAKLAKRIQKARDLGAPGVALYASAQLDAHAGWSMLADGPFESPARVPR